jgi:hypothetical protein
MRNLTQARTCLTAILFTTLATAVPVSSDAQELLYGIDGESPFIDIIDPFSGQIVSSMSLTMTNLTIEHGSGLAVNPLTNEMYAAVHLANQPDTFRTLVTIDPQTGFATPIGTMTQGIAGMTFTNTGVLLAVSGERSDTPETLFTVNTNDASLSFVRSLGNGTDGESIAFNPVDGFLYHMSGRGPGFIFERINLSTGSITAIAISGDDVENAQASGLAYDASRNLFVGGLIDFDFFEGSFGTITS